MAFKRKQDNNSGEQAKFEKVGDNLTGIYLGSFDHDGEYGPTKKHLFKTDKGVKVVFGQTHLTQLLEDEKPGILVRVTFDSTKKGKKGNPMKMYTLDIDDTFQADEGEVNTAVDAATNSEDYDDNDAEETAEEVVTAPAKPRPAARPPSASSQAAVQALLAKARRTA